MPVRLCLGDVDPEIWQQQSKSLTLQTWQNSLQQSQADSEL